MGTHHLYTGFSDFYGFLQFWFEFEIKKMWEMSVYNIGGKKGEVIVVKGILVCINVNSQVQGRKSIVLHQNPEILILDLSFVQ